MATDPLMCKLCKVEKGVREVAEILCCLQCARSAEIRIIMDKKAAKYKPTPYYDRFER